MEVVCLILGPMLTSQPCLHAFWVLASLHLSFSLKMFFIILVILVSVNFEMINYLKLVRFEMLCITLTPIVECKSIFIIIIIMIIIFYYQYNYILFLKLFLHIILYFKSNYLEEAITY